ncbi:MAG: transcription termination factor Rho [Prevotella sp.]
MFEKQELQTKDAAELVEIARSLNIAPETISSPEEAIDRIMAAQEESEAPQKRPRKRILKKEVPDHVYSVNGIDGKNLDTRAAKRRAKASTEIFSIPAAKVEEEVNPFPKHRGRKSKAELEYLARLSEQEGKTSYDDTDNDSVIPATRNDEPVMDEYNNTQEDFPANESGADNVMHEEAETTQANTSLPPFLQDASVDVTEQDQDSYTDSETNTESQQNLIAQLQAKMNAHNNMRNDAYEDDYNMNDVWPDDPADGTDFIIIVDLPIEDTSATRPVDIFGVPQNTEVSASYAQHDVSTRPIETYDFSNIVTTVGLMEVMPENYGFLRSSDYNYLSSPDDVFVSMQTIRKLGLKTGDVVECTVCPPVTGEKYFTVQEVKKINGRDPQDMRDRVPFEHLTPLFPNEKFNICGCPSTTNTSTRIVDLFSPIGKGQRSLIVAQPKTGKTILMKDIANAIAASHPEAYLMMLLIDERPEEVTDMARTVNAEVIASTFDEPAERHVKIAGLVLEKAKRMVECGHDVVIFLDSITRLARAYNTVAPASGKILTGGVDANALQKPKRFFGAARNIEGGGSLTIIATALTDTGSKMDDVIFEEFKGTGNMELQLERVLSNKRIFPAVNLVASSTRRDDLLYDKSTLDKMWIIRNFISNMNPVEAMNEIKGRIERTSNNDEFLLSLND